MKGLLVFEVFLIINLNSFNYDRKNFIITSTSPTSLKDKSLRSLDFSNQNNVIEKIIFKNKIGRIRDIQVQSSTGKIYFLSEEALWLMEKN